MSSPTIQKWIKIVVMRLLREKGLTRLDVSTLISAGNLGYAQCLRRFDVNRGVKFKTYAEHRIKGAVLDEVRKMIGDERAKTPRPRKVDDFDFDLIGDSTNQSDIESSIDFDFFVQRSSLDLRELEMLKCRFEGYTIREISQKFSFSEARASQLLCKIKKEVYLHYHKDSFLNFKLVSHQCPCCQNEIVVSDRAVDFKCDMCDVDLVIEGGIPILAVKDISESGEELDVLRIE